MCISQQVRVLETGQARSHVNVDIGDVGSMTAQQTWSRSYRQPMKPRLPRRLTNSARIDLNRHWGALEHLVLCSVVVPSGPTRDADADADVEMSNAINENLANERLEADTTAFADRFVPVSPTLDEVANRDVLRKKPKQFWKDFQKQLSGRQTTSSTLLKIMKKLGK